MNISVNTPFLKTAALNEDLDTKVLMIFIILISILVVLGMIFLRLVSITSTQLNQDHFPSDNPPDSLHTLITL